MTNEQHMYEVRTYQINFLNWLISEGNGGEPLDFERWRKMAHAALVTFLGPSHSTTATFESIDYSRAITPVDARVNGVRTGISMLHAAVTEAEAARGNRPS